jgi:uncharacterized membrane protein YtjA (UPF0391 family)
MFAVAIASLIVALLTAVLGFTHADPEGASLLASMVFPLAMAAFVAASLRCLLVGEDLIQLPMPARRLFRRGPR